jgi:hypothetical protein
MGNRLTEHLIKFRRESYTGSPTVLNLPRTGRGAPRRLNNMVYLQLLSEDNTIQYLMMLLKTAASDVGTITTTLKRKINT